MTEQPPDSSHRAAKDLAHENPAPMEAKLAGYPWLPRMIDKARASHAGTLGTYYRYPCPIDQACLELLGINADSFREIAHHATEDQEVVNGLADVGASLDHLRSFDPVQLNAELHRSGS
jgi:hypothetical protein